jgi:hypothetical protein
MILHSAGLWFETSGVAALLTIRAEADLILKPRACAAKDAVPR